MRTSIDPLCKSWKDRARLIIRCLAVLPLLALPARAEMQVMQGTVPRAVASLTPIGDLAATETLNLAIGLPLPNPEALNNLLRQIYDPTSPLYRQYLTPEQFTERFGPSKEDYQTLIVWAKANNLTVTAKHPNRIILDVSGSVADIQKALHVTMRVYDRPGEARTFFAPSAEPQLDISIPILHISGLDNYSLATPKLHKAADNTSTNVVPHAGSGPEGNYMGYDFRSAYVPGTLLTGAGQSVGLLEFDGYFPNDVAAYLSQAGLPSVPLINVFIDGFTGPPGPGNTEVTLDIDMAIAMAPGLSSVIVYMAPNNISLWVDILSRMASDNLAKQLSCSWGGGGEDPTAEQIFLQMAVQGQSFFDAQGDDDAFVGGKIPFPGDSPNITQVGGTTLSTSGPLGSWVSEKAWNWGGGIGTCGGISTNFAIPAWQLGIDMTTNQGSATMRNLPDVALTADDIYIIADNGFQEPGTGGTSCAAPLWAGFTALMNQQATQGGLPPVGFLNPAIYAICKSPLYGATFHDTVLGNNFSPTSPNLFAAVSGYDLCTGWGTPAGTNLINILVPATPTAFLVVISNSISGGNGNGVVDPDECNDFNVTLANFGGAVATVVRATLSATTPGVSIAQTSSAYPDIQPGGFGTNLVPFKISTIPSFVCGTPIDLTLVAKCSQSSSTNQIRLLTGSPGTNVLRFDNSTPAAIPDLGETNSPVVVSNVTAGLNKVTVSLYITHTFDSDLLLQLISPDGVTNILSASNGGGGHNYGNGCSPDSVRTTFDDAASNSISSGNPPFIGSFQPQTPLSVFAGKSGTNVNGTWRLRAVDQAFLDSGTIQCWSLFLTPARCTDGGGECPGADLALTMIGQPNPVILGQFLTYTITLTNYGPGTAKSTVISQQLPSGVVFVSGTVSQGSFSQAGGLVTGTLGTLAVGASASMTIVVIPTIQGFVSCTASVSSSETDPDLSNNSATVVTQVNPTSADLAVGISASPNPGVLGATLTYTVSVTNNGPSDASGVTVTNVLPASATIISATTLQGSITSSGNFWTIGTLLNGGTATATITVAPTVSGTLVATSTVRGTQLDSVPANNTFTLNTLVGPSADLAIGIADFPDPAVTLSNVTYVVSVTNNGPSAATGVNVNQFLPINLPVVSTTPGQGTVNISGNTLGWAVGSMPSGSKATLTVTITTVTNGTLTTSATVAGDQPDPNTANNSASQTTVVSPPGTSIAVAGATLTSESFSPPNGAIDIGETVVVVLRLRNSSNVSTLNLVGTLQTNANIAPVPPNNPQSYGVLSPSGLAVGRPFSFTANGTNGQTITASLLLHDGATTYPPVSFNFTLPSTQTFTSTNGIAIRDKTNGLPYPSTILVSGFNGTVGKVSATVSNLTHTFAPDIDILLASPNGADSMLMSDAGGNSGVANATITFDDTAASPVPEDSPLTSGIFQPGNYLGNNLPNPAPTGPYPAAMSMFNGGNPNGIWSLYVNDHTAGDTGSIAGGWSLTFTTITPVNQLADLALAGVATPSPAAPNSLLTYTFTVSNLGPSPASSVAFTNMLPPGVTLVSAASSQGLVITNATSVIGSLGTVSTGAVATVTIGVVPPLALIGQGMSSFTLTNAANVAASETDPNPSNNVVVITTSLNRPVADLGLSTLLTPNPAAATLPLTNMIVVTNRGPGTAVNVVLTNPLPAGASFLSATSSVGTCSNIGGVVTCSLGDLASNASATVSIIITPSLVGLLTNTVAVITGSQDTNTADNVVTNVLSVVNPTSQIINAGAVMTYESGPVNGLIDPGETVTLALSLANVGTLDTVNLKATLQASGGVVSPSGPQSYGALIHQGPSTSRSFTFTSGAGAGGVVVATLLLQDERPGVTNVLTPVTFTFNPPTVTHWAATNYITIPDHGAGVPYPSSINVSGLGGVVTKATVTLKGLTHSFPRDVNVLLVSPAGNKVLVMSHTGGGYSVTNLTLTFDDSVSGTLPSNASLASGTNKPTGYPATPVFPLPAPPAPFGAALGSVYGGTPNGAWSLFVMDDAVGDAGYILGGWTLDLQTATTLRSLADLAIGMSSAPGSLLVSGTVTNTVWVTNLGPASATGVIVTNSLSSGERITSAIGSLAPNAWVQMSFVLAPAVAGNIVDTASVGGNEADLNLANNTAQTTVAVTAPVAAILSGAMQSGQFHLSILGEPGFTYEILTSTNFASWMPIATNLAPPNGTIKFTDTNSPSYKERYYRTMHMTP